MYNAHAWKESYSKQSNKQRTLRLESLEERQLLTAAPYAAAPDDPEAIFQTASLPNTVEDPIEATTAVTLTGTASSAPLLPTSADSLTVPAGYNAHDYTALCNFLEQTDSSGVKNGTKINSSYDPADPATWSGITWTDVNGEKRISEINCSLRSFSGKLDVSGCTALTKLGCYITKLTSLDVSGCTALTALDCSSNQLTSLDVSGCTALKTLECYKNQLTSLDVSGCTVLTELDCYNNNLTSLDVSNNTALTVLNCYNNNLTSLDISNNTALNVLNCNNNNLTSLNLSNNTALTTLSCGYNNLTSLDVSNNTALTDLSCYDNQLTSLDVSCCTKLTKLSSGVNNLTSLNVSNNTALTVLHCHYNNLTALDVSGCTALNVLNCNNNNLTSLDVSNNTALTDLSSSYNNLTSLDVSNNTDLKWLSCYDNQLTSLDVSSCTKLTNLSCGDNNLTSLDVSNNTALTDLSSSNNNLTSLNVSNNTALKELFCDNNNLTSLDASNNTALTKLYCYNNNLTSLNVSNNTALTYLYCYYNQLTSLDVSNHTALIALSCNNNNLTSLDVSNNTALKWLRCNNNNLTSLDVSNHTDLTTLYCHNNQLTVLDLTKCELLTHFYIDVDSVEMVVLSEAHIGKLRLEPVYYETYTFATEKEKVVVRYNQKYPVTELPFTVMDAEGNVVKFVDEAAFMALCLAKATLSVSETDGTATAVIGSVENAERYILEYSENTDFTDAVTLVYGSAGSKTIPGLKPSTNYYFRVTAAAEDYIKSVSEVQTLTTSDSLSAIDHVGDTRSTAQTVTFTNDSFTFTDKLGEGTYGTKDVDIYKIELSADYTYTFTTTRPANGAAVDTFIRLLDGTSTGISEHILFNDNGNEGFYSQLTYRPTTSGTYYIGISSAQNRSYNPSTAPTAASGTRGDYTLTVTRELNVTTLTAPTLKYTSKTAATLNIEIGESASAYQYIVEYSTDSDFSASTTKTVTYSNYGSKTLTDLTGGTTYYLRAKAVSNSERFLDSAWSSTLSVSTDALIVDTVGDSRSDAELITFSANLYTKTDKLGEGKYGAKDVDIYKIEISASDVGKYSYTFTTSKPANGVAVDTYLRLLDGISTSTNVQLQANDDITAGNFYSKLTWTPTEAGTYYLGVSSSKNRAYNPSIAGSASKDGTPGDYTLTAVRKEITYLSTPTLSSSASDYKAVTISIGTVTGAAAYTLQYSLDEDFKDPVTRTVSSGTQEISGLESGKQYFFRAKAVPDASSETTVASAWSSTLTISTKSETGLDTIGDTLETSKEIVFPTDEDIFTYTDKLGYGASGLEDVDIYKLVISSSDVGRKFIFSTSCPSGGVETDTYLRLLDSTNKELASNDDREDMATGGYSQLEYTFTEAGTYYISVSSFDNTDAGDYLLTVQRFGIKLNKPTLSVKSTADNSVTLTVGSVQNASKYIIEYSKSSRFTNAVSKRVNSGDNTITGLEAGTTYYFRVQASASSSLYSTSEWSESVSTKTTNLVELKKPEILIDLVKGNTLRIQSPKIDPNAEYNLVEYSTDNSFSEENTQSRQYAASCINFIVLEPDTTYYVRYKAVAKADSGYKDSQWVTIDPITTEKTQTDIPLTAETAGSDSIKINIGAVSGVTAYTVEYSTYRDFSAKVSRKQCTTSSLMITGLTADTTYYFRAYADSTEYSTAKVRSDVISAKTAQESVGGTNYAVIFSGGGNISSNHPRYYDDVKYLYQTLTATGNLLPENIYVLFADGTNPENDSYKVVQSEEILISSDMKFVTGYQTQVKSATKENLTSVIGTIADKMTDNDHLLFYSFDHGSEPETSPKMVTSATDNEYLVTYSPYSSNWVTDKEFADILFQIDKGYVTLALTQCFAGGMLDNIIDPTTGKCLNPNISEYDQTNKWFGMAATSHFESSWGNVFSHFFITGLKKYSNTIDVFNYTRKNDICTCLECGDYTNNGGCYTATLVDGTEVYNYATEHPWAAGASFDIFTTPTISSNDFNFGYSSVPSLGNIANSVTLDTATDTALPEDLFSTSYTFKAASDSLMHISLNYEAQDAKLLMRLFDSSGALIAEGTSNSSDGILTESLSFIPDDAETYCLELTRLYSGNTYGHIIAPELTFTPLALTAGTTVKMKALDETYEEYLGMISAEDITSLFGYTSGTLYFDFTNCPDWLKASYYSETSTKEGLNTQLKLSASNMESGAFSFEAEANTTGEVRSFNMFVYNSSKIPTAMVTIVQNPVLTGASLTASSQLSVGEMVTIKPEPADATCLYQWYCGNRETTMDTLIPGEIYSSFTPSAEHQGKYISCVVTGHGIFEGSVTLHFGKVSAMQNLPIITYTQPTEAGGILTAPTLGEIEIFDKTTVLISWENVDNAASYTIAYRTSESSSWTEITDLTTTSASIQLQQGKEYEFKVKAVGAGNYTDSEWSETASAATEKIALSAPSLTASAAGTDSVTVTVEEVANASGYTLEYAVNADFTNAQTLTFTDSGSQTVTNLNANTTYYFRVKANGTGNYSDSAWSETASAATEKIALSAPSLTASAAGTDSVTVTVGEVMNASGYTLEYAVNVDFTNAQTLTFTDSGSQTVTNLNANTTYYFRVKANGTGNYSDSAWSETASAATEKELFAGYNVAECLQIQSFLEQTNENGVKNGTKLNKAYVAEDISTWPGITWKEDENGVKSVAKIFWKDAELVGTLSLEYFENLTHIDVSGSPELILNGTPDSLLYCKSDSLSVGTGSNEIQAAITLNAAGENDQEVSENIVVLNEWNTFNVELWTEFGVEKTFEVSWDSNAFTLDLENTVSRDGVMLNAANNVHTDANGITTITLTLRTEIGFTANVENTMCAALKFKPVSENNTLKHGESLASTISVDQKRFEMIVHSVIYDMNDDGDININDLVQFARLFGSHTENTWQADFNSTGNADITDLVLFARNFGLTSKSAQNVTYASSYVPEIIHDIQPLAPVSSVDKTENPAVAAVTPISSVDLAMDEFWAEQEKEKEEKLEEILKRMR